MWVSGFGYYSEVYGIGYFYNSFNGDVEFVTANNAMLFDRHVVFTESDAKESLPERADEETNADGSSVSGAAKNVNNATYSLYAVKKGGEKKFIMSNVALIKTEGDVLYVFCFSEGSALNEKPLYDVYGGTSINNIKLLIEGVCIK